MDAAFFILLIGIAMVLINQATTGGESTFDDDASDNLDSVVNSKISAADMGYQSDGRLMGFSELAAISLTLDDGKAADFAKACLDSVYTWDNAYCLILQYGDGRSEVNDFHEEYSSSVHRSMQVEFGGTLEITLYVYI